MSGSTDPVSYISVLFLVILTAVIPAAAGAISHADATERMRYESISKLDNGHLLSHGMDLESSGDADSALIYYNVLQSRYSPSIDPAGRMLCAQAYLKTGKIHYTRFSYSNAMDAFLKCRRICENDTLEPLLSETYRCIGNIYSMHYDYERAIEFYRLSLDIARRIGDMELRHKVLSNLTGASLFAGDPDAADRYYREMVSRVWDNPVFGFDSLIDGGIIAVHRGDNAKALTLYRQALDFVRKHNLDVTKEGAVNSWLANLYESTGRQDSALVYLHANEAMARTNRQRDLLTETLRNLASIYRDRGDLIRAQGYLDEYLTLSDEIFNQRVFNSLKNTQFQYETDKSDGIIRNLSEERMRQEVRIQMQRRMIWIISLSVMALGVLTFVIYRQKRKLSVAYDDLFDRNNANIENERLYKQRIRELEMRQDNVAPPEENVSDRSSLSDELRTRLYGSIMEVMEDTARICDPDFTINTLADAVGSNTAYVSKVINETFGKNFRTFLNEYRIKESMARLADEEGYGHYTIKAVAESVGFRSQSGFIAAFTKFTGMKPGMYQDLARRRAAGK